VGPPTSQPGAIPILLAPTNEQVAELNERARLDRLTNGGGSASATVTLGDGLTASAGDWIATRKKRPLAAPQSQ